VFKALMMLRHARAVPLGDGSQSGGLYWKRPYNPKEVAAQTPDFPGAALGVDFDPF
jgi:hypothetical protein